MGDQSAQCLRGPDWGRVQRQPPHRGPRPSRSAPTSPRPMSARASAPTGPKSPRRPPTSCTRSATTSPPLPPPPTTNPSSPPPPGSPVGSSGSGRGRAPLDCVLRSALHRALRARTGFPFPAGALSVARARPYAPPARCALPAAGTRLRRIPRGSSRAALGPTQRGGGVRQGTSPVRLSRCIFKPRTPLKETLGLPRPPRARPVRGARPSEGSWTNTCPHPVITLTSV